MRTNATRRGDGPESDSLPGKRQPVARTAVEGAGLAATVQALHRAGGNRMVQRFLAGAVNHAAEASHEVEDGINRTRGGGHSLPPGVRADMENAFGADFSPVRLHTDAAADALSRSLSADAFTTGRDIYFRQGQYDPDGSSGRRLLAHELTHVTQQQGTTPGGTLVVGPPGDAYEQEADQVAEAVMRHAPDRESPRSRTVAGPGQVAGPAPAESSAAAVREPPVLQRMPAEDEMLAAPTVEEEEREPGA
jgi:uncharacterized protein DUF4157